MIRARSILAGLIFAASTSALAAPSYYQSGVQHNVAVSTVTGGGWTQCYAATMDAAIGDSAEAVLNACLGDYIIMAGRETGSDTLMTLAAAPLAEATFNTGVGSTTHLVNGANWWFADNWSWGFTAAGDTVSNSECDVSDSPSSMCLHTFSWVGGYRINNITGLNSSRAYEKVFFSANGGNGPINVPEPATLGLLSLGLLGLGAGRLRKRK